MPTTRILIHPLFEPQLLERVTEILDRAVKDHPDHFDHVIDQPGTGDHYGFYTRTLSCVVFAEESMTSYHRLTIRTGDHPVFDELGAVIAANLRPKLTPELLELSKQVLNDHGIRDAMPGDPGSIENLTVALRSLIKAVES